MPGTQQSNNAFALNDVSTLAPMTTDAVAAAYALDSATAQFPPYTHLIEKVFFPIVIVMGTICNLLIFMVMRRKKMRHQSTYFYMAVLAVDDQLVLIMGCLNYWLYLLNILNSMKNFVLCKLISFMCYSSLHFSVWIVVIMTVERFIAVALPLQANRLCTVKRAKMVTLLLVFIVICVNSHFIFTHAVEKTNSTNGVEEYHCQPIKQYDTFIRHVWPWIDASIYSIAPLVILIIFNTLIVHNLVKASKSISKLNGANSVNSRGSDNTNSTNLNNSNDRRVSALRKPSCQLSDYRVSSFMSSICCFFCLRVESFRSRKQMTRNDEGAKRNSDVYLNKSNYQTTGEEKLNSGGDENPKYKYKFKSSKTSLETNALYVNGQAKLSPTDQARKQSLPSKDSTTRTNTRLISSTNASQSSSANRRLTIMILVVSTAFFITSTPIVTLQMIDMNDLAPKSEHLLTIRGIFLVLQYLNHSINFFLYAVTGKTFRREFIALFKSFGSSNKKRVNSLKNHSNNSFASKRLPHSLSNMTQSPSGFNLANANANGSPNGPVKPFRKNGPYLIVKNSSIDEEDSRKSTMTRASPSDQDKSTLASQPVQVHENN